MKHITLLSITLLVCIVTIYAQADLTTFNKERYRINQTGFLVLSSWGAANIISGAVGWSSTSGQERYFHQMNLIWGSVNLLVALPGYLGARKGTQDNSLAGSVRGQAAIEKTFIFNAGLDIAYMAGSAWFLEKANNSSYSAKYKGYGKSILMQGAALFLFDAVMFTTHNRHGKKLYKLLSGIQAGPNSVGTECEYLILPLFFVKTLPINKFRGYIFTINQIYRLLEFWPHSYTFAAGRLNFSTCQPINL